MIQSFLLRCWNDLETDGDNNQRSWMTLCTAFKIAKMVCKVHSAILWKNNAFQSEHNFLLQKDAQRAGLEDLYWHVQQSCGSSSSVTPWISYNMTWESMCILICICTCAYEVHVHTCGHQGSKSGAFLCIFEARCLTEPRRHQLS